MNKEKLKCPDCFVMVQKSNLKEHIVSCKAYKPNILNNIVKLTEHLNPSYLKFISAELDLAKETLQRKNAQQSRTSPSVKEDNPPFQSTIQLNNIPLAKEEEEIQQVKVQKQTTYVYCGNCQRQIDVNKVQDFTYTYLCFHLLCKDCLVSYINDQYVKKKGILKCLQKGCSEQIPTQQIKQIIGPDFQKHEHELFRDMVNTIVCCKCETQFQFMEGLARDAPKADSQGKKVSTKAAEEYAKNRFICPNTKCKTQQCKNCKSIPYHLGKDCEQNNEFKEAKKCRYCKEALKKGYTSHLGIKSFDNICNKKQCQKMAKKACSKIHKCGHPCLGIIKQNKCLPCLYQKCAVEAIEHDQNSESYCSICYVQDLESKPSIMSDCGHIYHYECLQKRIKIRWLTPRILFTFCHCPLCKKWITLSVECSLKNDLKKYQELMSVVKAKAIKRLQYEELLSDKKLTDPSSSYYKQPEEYALAIYAYFECFKCKKPYFGGRKNCAQVMNADKGDEDYDPKKLICPECCPIPTKNCDKHGKQFLAFKCKFCCNIAQWFCWGNTHFCDPCHKKQIQGKYVSKMKKQDLPECEGPDKCPSGGDHKGNGEQYSLGCLLCRNYKQGKKDF